MFKPNRVIYHEMQEGGKSTPTATLDRFSARLLESIKHSAGDKFCSANHLEELPEYDRAALQAAWDTSMRDGNNPALRTQLTEMKLSPKLIETLEAEYHRVSTRFAVETTTKTAAVQHAPIATGHLDTGKPAARPTPTAQNRGGDTPAARLAPEAIMAALPTRTGVKRVTGPGAKPAANYPRDRLAAMMAAISESGSMEQLTEMLRRANTGNQPIVVEELAA